MRLSKNMGIIRKVDGLGRICLPKQIRKQINNGNSSMDGIDLEILVQDDMIIMKRTDLKPELNTKHEILEELKQLTFENRNSDYNRAIGAAMRVVMNTFDKGEIHSEENKY